MLEGSAGELEATLPDPSVTEKLDLALEFLARRTPHPGANIQLDPSASVALTWSKNGEEVQFLLQSLAQLGYLHLYGHAGLGCLTLAASGYRRLEELGGDSTQNRRIFVAMWFDPEVDEIYDHGFAPAITAAGFEPVRIDSRPHGDRIDAKILLEIRKCRALVADATGLRPSVFYEAGLAEGLGKPVFWTCRKDLLDGKALPFDTRQFPHTDWTNADDLKTKLQPILEYRLLTGRRR
jgi:hypothetical protein